MITRSRLLDILSERVLVFDGAMGTSVQNLALSPSDFDGLENCTDVLSLTRPDVVLDIHRSFLAVGCDAVETNTFGANAIVLSEFGIADRTREINRQAAKLAREACSAFDKPDHPRFVIGSIGPGTKLPSLLQTTWDALVESYTEQARGLIEGGVDAVVIETCQDILQTKSAVVAVIDAMREMDRPVPIFCTVTIETSGTMLVGSDIAAAATALQAYDEVLGLGLNCATGPAEMSEHVGYLSTHSDRFLIVQPNAGLPEMVDGKSCYALSPQELTRWLVEFVESHGVNIVGGCCGTTPVHMAAVVDGISGRRPTRRDVKPVPSVSSVYQSVSLRQDTSYLAIGERTNANGSKRFRELLASDDLDGMVLMARDQVRDGCHLLDVCTACVGRDEVRDMSNLIQRLATDVTAPLVIDSTEVEVIEAALKLVGGKCVINSIHLEGGEEKLDRVCRLAKRYGAALIALTIDEEGMAKTGDHKVAVAKRIYELATRRHHIRPGDLIFDPLTFTICTGNQEDRRLAVETLEAIGRIKQECPGSHTVLGISNVSYGLRPPARRVLNSVFLHAARQAGLDAAIVHTAGIVPLFKIDEGHRRLADDLIHDCRAEGYDPLGRMLKAFETQEAQETPEDEPPRELKPIEERLKRRVIDGDRSGLDVDLEEAMLTYPPLDIINQILLDGMKTVGDLFGAGQMQLPFVLQSAETMKEAVRHLEPHLEHAASRTKGTLVLATVAGDVHDIGKNLVDIILSNNGYRVCNLGIKQRIGTIIDAARKCDADVVGLSGLLVRSAQVMGENLSVLNEHGIDLPVILGGAALTRKHVEQDLRPRYKGPLFYARDAFAGLSIMDAVGAGEIGRSASTMVPSAGAVVTGADTTVRRPAASRVTGEEGPVEIAEYTSPRSNISREEPVPEPPFWGSRVIEHIDPNKALEYLNENMLFQLHWQYRKGRGDAETFDRLIEEQARPALRSLLDQCEREQILQLQAVYGFWPAQSDGDTLIVYDPIERDRETARFEFPRMGKPPYWCLSDFFRPTSGDAFDVAAFSLVTVGGRVSEVERAWFEADRYKDYLYLHGLGVELAEALAEYVHKRIRVEWNIAGQDASDKQDLFKQHYQGSRYSFGYPACPRLEDQVKLWPLLTPERIGVSLTETFQLEPEQSTTALITHHRQAKYFNVR